MTSSLHFSHTAPLPLSGHCPHLCSSTLWSQSLPVRFSVLLGPLFHWACTTCYSRTNPSALSCTHFYFLQLRSHELSWQWYPDYTLNTFAPVSLWHAAGEPQPEWSLLLAFPTHWYQISWVLLEQGTSTWVVPLYVQWAPTSVKLQCC